MPTENLDPSGVATEGRKPSRRDLLKGALIALGAGVILQPNGGVLAGAFGAEPKRKKKKPKGEELIPRKKKGVKGKGDMPEKQPNS